MNKLKYTPNEIAYIGMSLALIILGKFITAALPDMPGGMGSPLMVAESFLLMIALVFGKKITIMSVLVYLLAFCWISPATFIGGILWVDGNVNRLGVYIFDYFIPYIAIASISIVKDKDMKTIIGSLIMIIVIKWFSHTLSGYIFFSDYSWTGWAPFTYSAVYNIVRSSIIVASFIVILPTTLYFIKPYIQQNKNSWL